MTRKQITSCGLAALMLLLASSPSWAQKPKPPAKPPAPRPAPKAPAPKPPAPPVHHDAPAAHAIAPPPPKPATPAAQAEPAPELPSAASESNPAVREVIEMPRKEPRDYVNSILLFIELGRPELAKIVMYDLAKLEVTDPQRVAIVDEFGSQGMLQISQTRELQPDGAAFADACMAAAHAAATNPERIAKLVGELTDDSPDTRTAARNDLAATGQLGANAVLEALAHETNPHRRAALVSAAYLMHPLVDQPLVAMLATSDANLHAVVATLLQRLAVPQAAPLLMTDFVSSDRALTHAIHNYQHGTPPFVTDELNQVEYWKWDDAAKKLSSTRIAAEDAQLAWISRLTDESARMRPDNTADQIRALVLRLETTGLIGGAVGSGKRINPASLAQVDPQTLSSALASALKENFSHAALALVDAIGASGGANALNSTNGQPSPLAAALDSPSRRVRFAALKAIMAINPATPYAGSSRLPDALAWFAADTGEHQAVVAMPNVAPASDITGQLAAQQIMAEAANRGRNAVDIARTMPGLALAMVDMDLLLPDARETVYELRTSPTTSEAPIAVLAADGRLDIAKQLAAEHSRVIAVPRPHTPEAIAAITNDLLKLSARDEMPPDERTAEAEQAKKWLSMLTAGNRSFYTIRPLGSFGHAHPAPLAPPAAGPPAGHAPATDNSPPESLPNP